MPLGLEGDRRSPEGTEVRERGRSADLAAAEAACRDLLNALGVGLETPHLRDTPRRMAQGLHALLSCPDFHPTTFENSEYGELIVVRDIRFNSLCAHHALPFVGTADVGYRPAARILGLSKVARAVHLYARRLQVQEELTGQIADWFMDVLSPKAVGVRIRAEHMCMSLRGVQAIGTVTTTTAFRGDLVNDAGLRAEWNTQLA
jgi:GTP cyclohydrolase I